MMGIMKMINLTVKVLTIGQVVKNTMAFGNMASFMVKEAKLQPVIQMVNSQK